MSYILDALKKAEAERRTGVPAGLHAPLPGANALPHTERKTALRTPWPWIGMTAIAALLAAYAWWRPAPAVPPVALQTTPTAAPAATAATAATPAPAAAAPVPAPTEPPKPQPTAVQAAVPPTPPAIDEEAPAPSKHRIAKPAKPAEKKRPAATETKPAEPASPPPPTLRELPDNIQREIPQLSVGGYIYSGSKADRSVLINNRLMHEGEEIAPGLTLEKMMPNGMVLNYRGYRYRTGY